MIGTSANTNSLSPLSLSLSLSLSHAHTYSSVMIDTRVAFSNLDVSFDGWHPGRFFKPGVYLLMIDAWHPGCFFKPGVYPLMVDTRVAFSNLGCILWWLTVDTRVAFSNLGCILWWLTPGLLFQTWGVTLVPTLSSAVLFGCKSVGLKLMVIVDVCLTTTYLLLHPEVYLYEALLPCLLHVQSIC